MDRDQILRLIEKEEGNKLKFKEIFNDTVLKTISAFVNTYSGLIIVGVDKKREIVGMNVNLSDMMDLFRTFIGHRSEQLVKISKMRCKNG